MHVERDIIGSSSYESRFVTLTSMSLHDFMVIGASANMC